MRIECRTGKPARFWLAMTLVYALIISWPVLSPDAMPFGHDTLFHLQRIEGIKEGLLAGQLPVRIHAFQFDGYGFPAGFFYPDLFLYIPALLRLCGVPLEIAFNILCLLTNLATALCSFWAFSRLTGSPRIGALSSMFYLGFLYRLVDVYIRTAVGEAVALAFLPAALAGLWLIMNGSRSAWIMTTIAFTGVLQSHILTSLMLFALAPVIVIVRFRQLTRRTVLMSLARAAFFTAVLNVWFYAPFYDMYRRVTFHMQGTARGGSLKNAVYDLAGLLDIEFFMGWAFILMLVALTFFCAIRIWNGGGLKGVPRSLLIMPGIGALCVCSMADFFPWELMQEIPVVGERLPAMQFPFRLMGIAAICLSLYMGALVSFMASSIGKRGTIAALLVLYFTGAWNFYALRNMETHFTKDDKYADWSLNMLDLSPDTGREFIYGLNFIYHDYLHSDINFGDTVGFKCGTTIDGIFSPLMRSHDGREVYPPNMVWMPVIYESSYSRLDPGEYLPPGCVTNISRRGNALDFSVDVSSETEIQVPLFYYPGYEARTEDGKALRVSYGALHRMLITAPSGRHDIHVRYAGLPAHRNACRVSLAGLALFIAAVIRERRAQKFGA